MNDTEKISCVEKSNLDILLDMYTLHKRETNMHTVHSHHICTKCCDDKDMDLYFI